MVLRLSGFNAGVFDRAHTKAVVCVASVVHLAR